MDWIKRNWYWVIPALCLVGYFVWMYVTAKVKVESQLAKARQAKADKAILTEADVSEN